MSNAELEELFNPGDGSNIISRENLNSWPIVATHQRILVLSIGAVFHAYCDVLMLVEKVWCVPLSVPQLFCVY